MRILIAINQARVLYDFKRELVSALLEQGHDLFLSFEEDFRAEHFEHTNAKIVATRVNPRGINPFHDYRLYRFYKRQIRKIRPDLVLTFTIKPNVFCGKACQKKHTRYIATISGMGTALNSPGLLGEIAAALYRSGLHGAERVFCQNESIERRALAEHFARPEQIVRVPGSGVDVDHFQYLEYPGADAPIELLFIGRLMRDKGVGEFLECARAFHETRPDVKFRILGAPERKCPEYRHVVNAANDGYVEYLGYQLDAIPYLQTASAVVLPSYHEGLSNVLLEGAASGRPVLASNIPGCAETFDEGVTGLGFEPRSADALVDAVGRFLETPYEERKAMGVRGREKIAAKFNRKDVVQVYLDEIARLVKR